MLLEVLLESDPPVMEFFDEDGSVISVNAFQSKCNLLAREYFKRAKDVGIHHTDRTWEVVELARIRMSYLSHERYLREVLILSPDELYDKAREHEYLLNKTEAAKEQRKILGLKSEYTIRRLALGYLLLAYKLGFSVPKDDFIAHAYYFAKHKEDGVPEEIRKFIESVLADKEWMESDPEKDDDSNEDGNIHSSSYPDL
ncbi:MAG: hypothetical protein JWM56_1081 [Candidatus Peribacteria bacterium]|nr:hypothetical protein [Candidatus Peribacteria bacterium]